MRVISCVTSLMLTFDEDFNLQETSKAESKLLLGKSQVSRLSNLI